MKSRGFILNENMKVHLATTQTEKFYTVHLKMFFKHQQRLTVKYCWHDRQYSFIYAYIYSFIHLFTHSLGQRKNSRATEQNRTVRNLQAKRAEKNGGSEYQGLKMSGSAARKKNLFSSPAEY